jgi:YD repeat-containing protein
VLSWLAALKTPVRCEFRTPRCGAHQLRLRRPGRVDGYGDYTQYYYAADGTLDEEAANDGGGLGVSAFEQTLDGDYRVTSDGCVYCDNTTGSGSVGHTFTYQYDSAGRLIFINATGGVAAYQTYDPDGNRITHDDVITDIYTNYTYNADNSIATTVLSLSSGGGGGRRSTPPTTRTAPVS